MHVASSKRNSRFVLKYVESCEAHIKRAANTWRNIICVRSLYQRLLHNASVVNRMASSAGTAGSSLSGDISCGAADVAKLKELMQTTSCSYWVINETLLAAAARFSKMHRALESHGTAQKSAREAKSAALNRLRKQEENYSEAINELGDFLEYCTHLSSKVQTPSAPFSMLLVECNSFDFCFSRPTAPILFAA